MTFFCFAESVHAASAGSKGGSGSVEAAAVPSAGAQPSAAEDASTARAAPESTGLATTGLSKLSLRRPDIGGGVTIPERQALGVSSPAGSQPPRKPLFTYSSSAVGSPSSTGRDSTEEPGPSGYVNLPCALSSAPKAVKTVVFKNKCSWPEVIAAVTKAFSIDKTLTISHFVVVDQEGDVLSVKLNTPEKFWKIGNLDGSILQICTASASGASITGSSLEVVMVNGVTVDYKRTIPISINSLPDLSGSIHFALLPTWLGFKKAVAEKFNFVSPECITHVIFVDAEGDELSGHVNTDAKLEKFLQYRDVAIKVYTAGMPQFVQAKISFRVEMASNPDLWGNVSVSSSPTWEELRREIAAVLRISSVDSISHIIFVDGEGDELSGNVNSDLKVSKFLNQVEADVTVKVKVFAVVRGSVENKSALTESFRSFCNEENISELDRIASKIEVDGVDPASGLTAFLVSCQSGKLQSVKWLLQHGANVNQKSPDGSTGLHLAVSHKRDEIVNFLVASGGCNIFALNQKDLSPFLTACCTGNVFAYKLLSRRGAKPTEIQRSTGYKGIHLAAVNNQVGMIRFLLEENSIPVDDLDSNGLTPFLNAVISGQLESADLLKLRGANVNAVSNSDLDKGATALHLACKYGHIHMVSWLLQIGLSTDTRDASGLTPVEVSRAYKHDSITQFILDREMGNAAEVDAQFFRKLVNLQEFGRAKSYLDKLMKDSGFEYTVEEGVVLLSFAASCGHLTIAEYLIMSGTDPNGILSNRRSAFMEACEYGHLEMARYLLNQGVDIFRLDKNGKSALQLAIINNHSSIVAWLKPIFEQAEARKARARSAAKRQEKPKSSFSSLFSCVTVAEDDKHENQEEEEDEPYSHFNGVVDDEIDGTIGDSTRFRAVAMGNGAAFALHNAVKTRASIGLISVLVDTVTNVDGVDENRFSPLYIAVDENYEEAVVLLLEKGANIALLCDATGITPLHLICANGELKLLRIVLEMQRKNKILRGVNLNTLVDVNSNNILHTATLANDKETVQILVEEAHLDLDVPAAGNRTSLILACINSCTPVGIYLIDQGCDKSFKDAMGGTAILYAIMSNDVDLVQYLVLTGASLNDRSESGNGVMHVACQVGNLQLVKWLFSKDVPINTRNLAGVTPYAYARKFEQEEIVEWFHELKMQGIDV